MEIELIKSITVNLHTQKQQEDDGKEAMREKKKRKWKYFPLCLIENQLDN